METSAVEGTIPTATIAISSRNDSGASDYAKLLEQVIQLQMKMSEANIEQSKQSQANHNSFLESQRIRNTIEPNEIFSGDVRKYNAFGENMKRFLATRTNMTNFDKINILRKKLSAEALLQVSNLDHNTESLEDYWAHLDQTYDQPRRIIEENIKIFMGDTKISKRQRSQKGLRDHQLIYNTTLTNLGRLNVTTEQVINYFCVAQMDAVTKSRFEDSTGMLASTNMPCKEDINAFFMKELIVVSGEHHEKRTPHTEPNEKKGNKQVVAMQTTTSEKRKYKCFICQDENHMVPECPKFLNSTNRAELLKEHKVCLYCIKHKFDPKNKCKSRDKIKCDKCNGSHHTLLHRDQTSTLLCNGDKRTNKIFATARLELLPEEGHEVLSETLMVRGLLDLCSQESFISE